MMNENIENLENNESIVALSDDELEQVAGGASKRFIEADEGKSYVRTGPGKSFQSIGVIHRGESARYLGNISTDERGVTWYQVSWNGRKAWVSSMYTRKVSYK